MWTTRCAKNRQINISHVREIRDSALNVHQAILIVEIVTSKFVDLPWPSVYYCLIYV